MAHSRLSLPLLSMAYSNGRPARLQLIDLREFLYYIVCVAVLHSFRDSSRNLGVLPVELNHHHRHHHHHHHHHM